MDYYRPEPYHEITKQLRYGYNDALQRQKYRPPYGSCELHAAYKRGWNFGIEKLSRGIGPRRNRKLGRKS